MADQTLHGTNNNDALNGGGNRVDRFHGGEGAGTIRCDVESCDTDGNGFCVDLDPSRTRCVVYSPRSPPGMTRIFSLAE